VQYVNGEQVLTGIYGHDGVDAMVNQHYEFRDRLPLDKANINMHDFNVVENGTRALQMNIHRYKASAEESAAVGFDGQCKAITSGFKEYDTATWEVLFEWDGADRIPINESYLQPSCKKRWDFMSVHSSPDLAWLN